MVYVGSYDAHLYELAATGGTEIYACVTGDAIASSPAAANGLIYFGSFDWYIYAELCTGVSPTSWPYQTNGPVISSPAVGP